MGVIIALFVHNNGTTPRHIGVGPNVWAPPQYALVLCIVSVLIISRAKMEPRQHVWFGIK